MDPNANLQEQERLVIAIRECSPIEPERTRRRHMRARLNELRAALAEWIRRGGFAPDWTAAPNASLYYGRFVNVTLPKGK